MKLRKMVLAAIVGVGLLRGQIPALVSAQEQTATELAEATAQIRDKGGLK